MRPSKRGRAQASIPSSRMAGSLEARLPCVNIMCGHALQMDAAMTSVTKLFKTQCSLV